MLIYYDISNQSVNSKLALYMDNVIDANNTDITVSPITVSNLSDGSYNFMLKINDINGNFDATPITPMTMTLNNIDVLLPVLNIISINDIPVQSSTELIPINKAKLNVNYSLTNQPTDGSTLLLYRDDVVMQQIITDQITYTINTPIPYNDNYTCKLQLNISDQSARIPVQTPINTTFNVTIIIPVINLITYTLETKNSNTDYDFVYFSSSQWWFV